ncbi:MAG: triple tyrosine motif-containing protein [Solirubrobacterales bacterium]
MNEFNIEFNLASPQDIKSQINISINTKGEYLFKFLAGFEGKWSTLRDFSESGSIIWVPEEYGIYTIMVQIRDLNSSKSFNYVSKAEYEIKEVEEKHDENSLVSIDEIVMEKKRAFVVNETIHIEVAASGSSNIRYSFLVRKDGHKMEEIKYGACNWVDFTPELSGNFQLEVRVKDKYSNAEFDSYKLIPIEVYDFIPAEIDYMLIPLKEYFVILDEIEIETIVQNTDKVLLKYILKINGQIIEETDFVEGKKYKFTPKSIGVYSLEVLAKNFYSNKDFDSSKEIGIKVYDYYPISNAEILCDNEKITTGTPVTFSASCRGGKDVLYEFYIMENSQWKLVQNFSKKRYYTFIPFDKGNYKVLVLMKSRGVRQDYEKYNIYSFNIE